MVGKLGSMKSSELCHGKSRPKTQIVVLLHVDTGFRGTLHVEFIPVSDIFSRVSVNSLSWRWSEWGLPEKHWPPCRSFSHS